VKQSKPKEDGTHNLSTELGLKISKGKFVGDLKLKNEGAITGDFKIDLSVSLHS
jgi:hypothetical protein